MTTNQTKPNLNLIDNLNKAIEQTKELHRYILALEEQITAQHLAFELDKSKISQEVRNKVYNQTDSNDFKNNGLNLNLPKLDLSKLDIDMTNILKKAYPVS